MADELDSLIFDVSAIDNFSKVLTELKTELAEIAAEEESVNPIRMDVDAAKAMAELTALDAAIESVEREVDIDVDVDRDTLVAGAAAEQIGLKGQRALDRQPLKPGLPLPRRGRERGSLAKQGLFQPDMGLLGLSDDVARKIQGADIEGGRRGSIFAQHLSDFRSLRLSMGVFMNLLASLLPLLGVFVGALPAVIAGFGALAGAALAAAGALMAAAGIIAAGTIVSGGEFSLEEIQRRISNLADTFIESFEPLFEALEPLTSDLFQGLHLFLRDLADRMHVMLQMQDTLRGFGSWLLDIMGPLIQEMMLFTDAAADVFGLIAGGIGDIDWFGIFADVLHRMLPEFLTFFGALMNMLPAIFDISVGFARVANALMVVGTIFWGILDVVDNLFGGILLPALGAFIGLMLTAITVSALYSWVTAGASGQVMNLASALFIATAEVVQLKLATIGLNVSLMTAYAITAALIGLLTFGLAPVLSSVASMFFGIEDAVGGATDELKKFADQEDRIDSSGMGMGALGDRAGAGTYSKGRNIVINAPDQETANGAAHTLDFKEGGATEGSNVNDREHSG